MAAVHDVSLWGPSGAGKTTLLAAALHWIYRRPEWLDLLSSAHALDLLHATFRDLSVSRLPAGTSHAIDLTLGDVHGNAMRVRDLRGGDAGFPSLGADDVTGLRSASAVLLVLPSYAASAGAYSSIQTALSLVPRERPKVLVLTKAELVFTSVGAARFNERRGRLEDYELGAARRLVEFVGWPNTYVTSVFGFHGDRPASRLGPFGQVLPFDIQPAFVGQPLDHLHRELFP